MPPTLTRPDDEEADELDSAFQDVLYRGGVAGAAGAVVALVAALAGNLLHDEFTGIPLVLIAGVGFGPVIAFVTRRLRFLPVVPTAAVLAMALVAGFGGILNARFVLAILYGVTAGVALRTLRRPRAESSPSEPVPNPPPRR